MAKILIIDDNPMIQRLLEKYISGVERYETITAGDGRSGLEKVLRADGDLPALIIMDVLMPDLNGFEVARMLKANEKTKDIPIIFVTASNDEKSKRSAIEVGAVGYVAKPFRKEDILNVIEEHLPICP